MGLRAAISAVWFLAATGGGALAASPPPLEAYGRLPFIEDVELSPSGDRVAFIAVSGENRQLVVRTLDGKITQRLEAGQAKVRDLAWAGDDHLLITNSKTAVVERFIGRGEWFQVVSFNLKTRRAALLLDKTPSTVNSVLGPPVVVTFRGEPTVFVRGVTVTGAGTYDLYRIDLDTGRGRIHVGGTPDTASWLVGPDGAVLARTEHDRRRGTQKTLARQGAAWRTVLAEEGEDTAPHLVGRGRAPGTLLISKRAGDKVRLHEVSIADGAVSAPLEPADKTLEGVIYDPITGAPVAMRHLGERREYQFFDPALARAWDKVRRPFQASHLTLASWTPDFRKLVVRVEGAVDAGSYYLVDLQTNKADLLADAFPGVPPEAIAPVRLVSYKAEDGLEIPAYLTLPVAREARNLPLIVLPHGGPQSRDEPGFDWWSQALASRGYAVLQPQFRGSNGFGRKFVEAGYGQWGRKMQTDLSDGVRHLAKQGMIDPRRVCIMGASYGGYAALAGATLDPEVYRCAVSVAGVSNLAGMLASEANDAGTRNTTSVRYWSRFMGTSFRKRGELDAVSPARQAARAGGPILLIHGKDDTVVPYAQSAEMHRALLKAGKPVEFVTLAAEDHWLSRGATRLQMLNSAVAFVEKHNPPN